MRCGKEATPEDSFCIECGMKIQYIADHKTISEQIPLDEPEATKSINKTAVASIVLPVIVIFIIIAGGISFILTKSSNKNERAIFNFNQGMSEYKDDKYNAAIEYFSKAIEIMPDYTDAYFYRGGSYQGMDKYKLAISDYSMVIKLDRSYTDAYFYRGNCYIELDDYTSAIKDLNKTIKLDPNYAEAYSQRADIHRYKDKYFQAINDYTIAIRLEPKTADSYYWRGRSYYEVKKHIQAINDLSIAIKMETNQDDAYYWRGLNYFYINKFDNAIEDELTNLSLNQDKASTYSLLGTLYFARGEYGVSSMYFDKTIMADPGGIFGAHAEGEKEEILKAIKLKCIKPRVKDGKLFIDNSCEKAK